MARINRSAKRRRKAEAPLPDPVPEAEIVEVQPQPARKGKKRFGGLGLARAETGYRAPSMNLLKRPAPGKSGSGFTQSMLRGTARLLEEVLADFSIKGEVRDLINSAYTFVLAFYFFQLFSVGITFIKLRLGGTVSTAEIFFSIGIVVFMLIVVCCLESAETVVAAYLWARKHGLTSV